MCGREEETGGYLGQVQRQRRQTIAAACAGIGGPCPSPLPLPSPAGARPDEAVSWGKIRADAKPVKVCGDASILFPLIVSQTWARHWEPRLAAADPEGGEQQAANGST